MLTQLSGKFILSGNLVCKTGLHIGGSTIGLEIGGVDNPVIKDPLTDEPMIPGSSLKGKLRSLTEWYFGLIAYHDKHKGFQAYDCHELKDAQPSHEPELTRWLNVFRLACLFGPASDDVNIRRVAGPSRLTVRDAFLSENSRKNLEKILGAGIFTEVKTENALDRVTSEANPRPVERVPAGSQFEVRFIMDCYDPGDEDLFRTLFIAMALLEQSSLGGGGSRGNGQVTFENLHLVWRSNADYKVGGEGKIIALPGSTVSEVLDKYNQIQWPL